METPSVAASAVSVVPSGLLRAPDSSDGTVARESPEMRPSRAAEIPASSRVFRSRSANDCMTTLVAQATNVVKLFTLTPLASVATSKAVLQLHERIEWVQRDLGEDGVPASLTVLADRADVSRQLLQQWMSKSRAGQNPGRGDTFTKCARAWKVSLDWLQTGVGEPRPSAYSPLEQALSDEAWAAPAVAAAKAHYEAGARLGISEWHRFLRKVHELVAAPSDGVTVVRRPGKRDAG